MSVRLITELRRNVYRLNAQLHIARGGIGGGGIGGAIVRNVGQFGGGAGGGASVIAGLGSTHAMQSAAGSAFASSSSSTRVGVAPLAPTLGRSPSLLLMQQIARLAQPHPPPPPGPPPQNQTQGGGVSSSTTLVASPMQRLASIAANQFAAQVPHPRPAAGDDSRSRLIALQANPVLAEEERLLLGLSKLAEIAAPTAATAGVPAVVPATPVTVEHAAGIAAGAQEEGEGASAMGEAGDAESSAKQVACEPSEIAAREILRTSQTATQ